MRVLQLLCAVLVFAHGVELLDRSGLASHPSVVSETAQAVRDVTSGDLALDVDTPGPIDEFMAGVRPIVSAFDEAAEALG